MSTDMPISEHSEPGAYRVVHGQHGVAIYGPLPVSDMLALQRAWKEKGLDILDIALCGALGATLCVTSRVGSKAWRAEIEERAAREAGPDLQLRWALGCSFFGRSRRRRQPWAYGRPRDGILSRQR